MEGTIKYDFSGELWKHSSSGGWYFISLPKHLAKEIREHHQWQEEGWGRIKALAKIGEITWDTAIWYDTKKETYLMPIKAEIRKKSNLEVNQIIETSIWI